LCADAALRFAAARDFCSFAAMSIVFDKLAFMRHLDSDGPFARP
jgi:hypothetical protein